MALGKTVKQLLQEITAVELEEWRVYERIEPFGFHADELRFARLQSQICNMMMGKKDKQSTPLDFLPPHPRYEPAKKKRLKELTAPTQTVDQMKMMVKAIHGAKKKK